VRAVLLAMILLLLVSLFVTSVRAGALKPRSGHGPDAVTLFVRAAAAYHNGQLDSARHLVEEALRLDPRSGRAHALLGLVLARQNAIQGALRNLREAHEIEPSDRDYAYDYAVLLVQDRQFTSAAPILESLHRRSPEADDVLVNLARAYAGERNSQKLCALAADLPSQDYANQSLLKALATILASSRQTAAVEKLWEHAIDHDPDSPLPYAALAELWIAEGQPRRAQALLGGVPAAARGPVYSYALGETQMALHDYDQALQSFRRLTQQLPGNGMAWQRLVQCSLLAGRLEDAAQAAAQASRRFPLGTEFSYQEAVAEYMLGRTSVAITALKPVLETADRRDARPSLLMAVLESETGNYQSAIRYFGQAQQLSAGCNALASYFYGATLLRMHQLESGQVQFENAIRCRPHFALAEYRLGQALAEAGKLRQALAPLEQATRDEPALADPYYALARIRRRLGDPEGAQAALRQFNSLHDRVVHSDRNLFRTSAVGIGVWGSKDRGISR
jgi:predicted Zn-dependent protease